MLSHIYLLLFVLISNCNKEIGSRKNQLQKKRTSYYFSVTGADENDGSATHPFQTIAFLNSLRLNPGDSILLKAGEAFTGSIILQSNVQDMAKSPITITSYGNGNAIINGVDGAAVTLNQSAYINISNIICKGSGRKDGNISNGFVIDKCNHINVANLDISGFQKAGLLIYSSSNINADKIVAHDNGFAGISVSGQTKKDDCKNIHISNSTAINNPGDPTNFNNHSGNGIIAGFCKNVLIEYCSASNNGWDMPRIGNGPVGIWCYEADSVVIQHCISYQNKTAKGADDGGGYDFDGGTTNSVIQYCLSYENQGSAFGIFQYAGASDWHDNVVRFCISANDGKVSAAHAATYIWNSSGDSAQFKNFLFYNNTIYNDSNAAINYSSQDERSNFKFYNNLLIASDEIIKGNPGNDIFLANDWWSLKRNFNINGNYNFKNWCTTNNKEKLNDRIIGMNFLPSFKNPGIVRLTDPNKLIGFDDYIIIGLSPVTQAGIDLQGLYSINTGDKDFNKKLVNKNCLGACTTK